MDLTFYNTLSRSKEPFVPSTTPKVGFYSCGPTVYNYAHIGNLRAYVVADLIEKTLTYAGYDVHRVMNITDIGHLTSDADAGEDKMTKGLLREGKELTLKNMRALADFYTEKFKEDLTALNIAIPREIHFASDHIAEDITLIETLFEKGYAYKISDGIYFDVQKFPDYFKLSGKKDSSNENEARIEVNSEKKNQTDFALWKFDTTIGFPSPWGQGFPGWHIECSAMSMKYLGDQFDIHTGGIDHIPVHHTNEIAQSEAATGKAPFVKYWMHNEHIDISGAKMAKSGDNFITLQTLIEKGLSPVSYRFWLLMAHYRTKMNFNWEALKGAEIALKRLYNLYKELGSEVGQVHTAYKEQFDTYLANDLDTPRALTIVWDLLKDSHISNADKKATVLLFDTVLGLGLANLKQATIPDEILELAEAREVARKAKNFKQSDELRAQLHALGYEVKDVGNTYEIRVL